MNYKLLFPKAYDWLPCFSLRDSPGWVHNPGGITSRHRKVNLLDPGHETPDQHQLVILMGGET